MSKLIIANWKMNPEKESAALRLARAGDFRNVVIAPPFVFLEEVGKVLKEAELGAQDFHAAPKNKKAFTGEVSAKMLKNLGVKYVIIGHSERRALGETDALINKKVSAALRVGLKVILCVGENLSVRRGGIAAAKKFVKSQLKKDLKFPKNYRLQAKNLIVAYEPIWAIGTGRNDSPEDAGEIVEFIKKLVSGNWNLGVKTLYGGSVDGKNISEFLEQKTIDGFLVGGASLKAGEFGQMWKLTKRK